MSVPSWKRSVSKSEYIRMLYDLNVRIGQIVMNKPKKYRGSYADMLIKSSLEALKYAQVANSIFMAASTPNEDYTLRRKCLLQARGMVENIATTSQIFLELYRNADREESEKIYREEAYIGESCGEIVRKISGVLKSDASIFRKKK